MGSRRTLSFSEPQLRSEYDIEYPSFKVSLGIRSDRSLNCYINVQTKVRDITILIGSTDTQFHDGDNDECDTVFFTTMIVTYYAGYDDNQQVIFEIMDGDTSNTKTGYLFGTAMIPIVTLCKPKLIIPICRGDDILANLTVMVELVEVKRSVSLQQVINVIDDKSGKKNIDTCFFGSKGPNREQIIDVFPSIDEEHCYYHIVVDTKKQYHAPSKLDSIYTVIRFYLSSNHGHSITSSKLEKIWESSRFNKKPYDVFAHVTLDHATLFHNYDASGGKRKLVIHLYEGGLNNIIDEAEKLYSYTTLSLKRLLSTAITSEVKYTRHFTRVGMRNTNNNKKLLNHRTSMSKDTADEVDTAVDKTKDQAMMVVEKITHKLSKYNKKAKKKLGKMIHKSESVDSFEEELSQATSKPIVADTHDRNSSPHSPPTVRANSPTAMNVNDFMHMNPADDGDEDSDPGDELHPEYGKIKLTIAVEKHNFQVSTGDEKYEKIVDKVWEHANDQWVQDNGQLFYDAWMNQTEINNKTRRILQYYMQGYQFDVSFVVDFHNPALRVLIQKLNEMNINANTERTREVSTIDGSQESNVFSVLGKVYQFLSPFCIGGTVACYAGGGVEAPHEAHPSFDLSRSVGFPLCQELLLNSMSKKNDIKNYLEKCENHSTEPMTFFNMHSFADLIFYIDPSKRLVPFFPDERKIDEAKKNIQLLQHQQQLQQQQRNILGNDSNKMLSEVERKKRIDAELRKDSVNWGGAKYVVNKRYSDKFDITVGMTEGALLYQPAIPLESMVPTTSAMYNIANSNSSSLCLNSFNDGEATVPDADSAHGSDSDSYIDVAEIKKRDKLRLKDINAKVHCSHGTDFNHNLFPEYHTYAHLVENFRIDTPNYYDIDAIEILLYRSVSADKTTVPMIIWLVGECPASDNTLKRIQIMFERQLSGYHKATLVVILAAEARIDLPSDDHILDKMANPFEQLLQCYDKAVENLTRKDDNSMMNTTTSFRNNGKKSSRSGSNISHVNDHRLMLFHWVTWSEIIAKAFLVEEEVAMPDTPASTPEPSASGNSKLPTLKTVKQLVSEYFISEATDRIFAMKETFSSTKVKPPTPIVSRGTAGDNSIAGDDEIGTSPDDYLFDQYRDRGRRFSTGFAVGRRLSKGVLKLLSTKNLLPNEENTVEHVTPQSRKYGSKKHFRKKNATVYEDDILNSHLTATLNLGFKEKFDIERRELFFQTLRQTVLSGMENACKNNTTSFTDMLIPSNLIPELPPCTIQ